MGCGSSTPIDKMSGFIHSEINSESNVAKTNIIEDFERLDIRISRIENMCPGPRLATAEGWIDHLQNKLDKFAHSSNIDINLPDTASMEDSNEQADKDVHEIAKLALNLRVLTDVSKAAAHEDFFSNLSKSSLDTLSIQFYNEVINHAKERAKTLLATYNELSALYVEQDGIIASISGGIYLTSIEEMLDAQLEVARDVRDKLGCAMEQWRTCGLLLKASAKSASSITKLWKEIKETFSPKEKVFLVLDCRHSIQASLVSLECAQYSLPHVEIKFLSRRQILALRHVNTYLLTDIADPMRYEHAQKVLETYTTNLTKASNWLTETYNQTLKVDFEKAEENVQGLAKSLREHRMQNFARELRI